MKKRLLFALALVLTALASYAPFAQAGGECYPPPPAGCIDPEGYCLCKQVSPHLTCMKNCTVP
jgi:hypothetical protein